MSTLNFVLFLGEKIVNFLYTAKLKENFLLKIILNDFMILLLGVFKSTLPFVENIKRRLIQIEDLRVFFLTLHSGSTQGHVGGNAG